MSTDNKLSQLVDRVVIDYVDGCHASVTFHLVLLLSVGKHFLYIGQMGLALICLDYNDLVIDSNRYPLTNLYATLYSCQFTNRLYA